MTKRQRQEAVEWGVLVAVLAFELLLIPRLHVPRAVIVLLYGLSIAALVWVVWRSSGRDIRYIEDAWER